jgi:Flp pilus assembly protein TadD
MSVGLVQATETKNVASRSAVFWLRCKAKAFLVLGLRKQAGLVFREILALAPNDVLAINSLGYEALQNGRKQEALEFFEKLVLVSPQNSNAHFNLGFVLEALARSEDADFARRFAWKKKWTGLGMAWVWRLCGNGDLKKPWRPSSATPSFNR